MIGFALNRTLRAFTTLMLVITFAFLILRLSGDPAISVLGPTAPAEALEAFRLAWGLNEPLWAQYADFVLSIFRGDFGDSMRDGMPALPLILSRLPSTLSLTLPSLILTLAIGIPAGIFAALHRNSIVDRTVILAAVVGFTVPSFVIGLVLVLIFAVTLGVLPSGGQGSWVNTILPIATMSVASVGLVARYARSAMLEVLDAPYIRAASAKGLKWHDVVRKHALPNAILPIVTVVGLMVGSLVAGSVVVESIFSWPGMGRLLIISVSARDLAVVQCILILFTLLMVTSNLVVDLLQGLLDPKLRAKGHS